MDTPLNHKRLIDLTVVEMEDVIIRTIDARIEALVTKLKKPQEKLYRRIDLAKKFGVTLQTIHAWVKHGILPRPKKIGRVPYFTEQQIDELMESRGGKL